MIQVDISGVWGEISLPDLLSIEQETADAHAALASESPFRQWDLLKIQEAAQTIRTDSEACVVVGTDRYCLGARTAMELLQRENGNPQILFAGNSFSTRKWQKLTALLEGKDVSVIVLSQSGEELESAIALRSLRWMLERKYGTEEANQRIYAVTDPEKGALQAMAAEYGWTCFPMGNGSALSPAGLLPMAVAGMDIGEVVQGGLEAREEYDLRSFENPVWLYAAVRNVLYRHGKLAELLETFQPDFPMLGVWWQQQFAQTGGILPVPGGAGLDRQNAFVTALRFAPPEKPHVIGSDWKNLDGLSYLEGRTLDFVEEQACQAAVEAWTEAGVPVITMDCGALGARKVGELLHFMELSGGVSAGISGAEPAAKPGAEPYGAHLSRLLGRTEGEKSCDKLQN